MSQFLWWKRSRVSDSYYLLAGSPLQSAPLSSRGPGIFNLPIVVPILKHSFSPKNGKLHSACKFSRWMIDNISLSQNHLSQHSFVRDMSSRAGFSEIGSSELQKPLNIEQISWLEEDGSSLLSIFYLGEELRGYYGITHGGIIAGIFDDLFARYCKHHSTTQYPFPVTKSLTIKYVKPAFSDQLFSAKITSVNLSGDPLRNNFTAKGCIKMLSSDTLVAESEAQFVFLREIPHLSRFDNNVERSTSIAVVKRNEDIEVAEIKV